MSTTAKECGAKSCDKCRSDSPECRGRRLVRLLHNLATGEEPPEFGFTSGTEPIEEKAKCVR